MSNIEWRFSFFLVFVNMLSIAIGELAANSLYFCRRIKYNKNEKNINFVFFSVGL